MGKWEPKEKRVTDIVDAAIEVFLEKGYEGASMEAIAKRAQISKGGMYHHFSSKEEVLFYVNRKLGEPISEFMNIAQEKNDVIEALKSYIRNYTEYWFEHQKETAFVFLTLTKAMSCPDMWFLYKEYYDKVEGFLTALYKKGIYEGKLIDHNAKESSVALLSALDGVLAYLIMNRGLSPDEVVRNFEERFIYSIVKK